MKLSLEQLASIPERNVNSFYLSTGFRQIDIEKYVGGQMNTLSLLRANLNKALNDKEKNHNEKTIEVLEFLEGKLKFCQEIVNNFELFKNTAQRIRPMSIAYAKQIIGQI